MAGYRASYPLPRLRANVGRVEATGDVADKSAEEEVDEDDEF
jgi:hypothetical protein